MTAKKYENHNLTKAGRTKEVGKMLKHVEAKFLGATERSAPDGRTIYRAIATTPALDRYGEVVLPLGCDDKHFKNNPVLLAIHDSRQVTIGHLHSWDITKDAITVEFTFTPDDVGKMFEQRYMDKDMNAFSIGFRSKAGGMVEVWSPWGGKQPDVKSMEFKLPNGETQTLDFTGWEQIPFVVYTSWEWLELSPVPVPANPEALLLREAEDIIRRSYNGSPVMRSFVQEKVKNELGPILKALRAFTDKSEIDFQIDGVIPVHVTSVDMEADWNPASAKTELARWASTDGSGKKEVIDWSKFSKGFASFDPTSADMLTSYKYVHHVPEGDELKAVWRGVSAAMAALLENADGTEMEYNHLAAHFKDAGKTAPAWGTKYSPEEIKSIENGSWGEARAEQAPQTDPTEEITEAKATEPETKTQPDLDKLLKAVRDLAESVDKHFIDLSIRMTMVEERIGAVPAAKAEPKTVQDPPAAEQGDSPATVSASFIKTLSSFTA